MLDHRSHVVLASQKALETTTSRKSRHITLKRIALSTLVVLLPFALVFVLYHGRTNMYDNVNSSAYKSYGYLYRNSRQLEQKRQIQQQRRRRQQGLIIPWLEAFGGNPLPSFLPLKVCQGDCDEDQDCDVGLICFQRESNQPVPGCQGGETFEAKTDFCILDPGQDEGGGFMTTGTPTFITTPGPTGTPTKSPTALVAVTTNPPSISPTTESPTTSPTSSPTTTSSAPPSLAAPQQPNDAEEEEEEDLVLMAQYVADNGSPESAFPLQQCQSDCDRDGDCAWGLYCHEREFDDDPIPGCTTANTIGGDDGDDLTAIISRQGGGGANDIGNKDFCLRSPSILPGAFRLKLYWEEGYVWQNSTEESFWCATGHFDGYPGTGNCWYGEETQECTTNHTYLARCDGTGLNPSQQAWRFLRINNSNNTNNDEEEEEEVLIQSAAIYDRRCWERYKREIFLNACDPTNEKQRWIASNGTSFFDAEDNRFEISQIDYGRQCVSNAHHPKPGEVVELHSCVALRKNSSQTAYWSRY